MMDANYGEECEARFYQLATMRSNVNLTEAAMRLYRQKQYANLTAEIDAVLDNYNIWRGFYSELASLL